jgi:hypothetical protein
MSILDLKYDACASIWMSPCTFEELCERLDKPQLGFWSIIKVALDDGLLYQHGEVLKCKKTTAKMLNTKGYELHIPTKPVESAFVKSLRKQGLIP